VIGAGSVFGESGRGKTSHRKYASQHVPLSVMSSIVRQVGFRATLFAICVAGGLHATWYFPDRDAASAHMVAATRMMFARATLRAVASTNPAAHDEAVDPASAPVSPAPATTVIERTVYVLASILLGFAGAPVPAMERRLADSHGFMGACAVLNVGMTAAVCVWFAASAAVHSMVLAARGGNGPRGSPHATPGRDAESLEMGPVCRAELGASGTPVSAELGEAPVAEASQAAPGASTRKARCWAMTWPYLGGPANVVISVLQTVSVGKLGVAGAVLVQTAGSMLACFALDKYLDEKADVRRDACAARKWLGAGLLLVGVGCASWRETAAQEPGTALRTGSVPQDGLIAANISMNSTEFSSGLGLWSSGSPSTDPTSTEREDTAGLFLGLVAGFFFGGVSASRDKLHKLVHEKRNWDVVFVPAVSSGIAAVLSLSIWALQELQGCVVGPPGGVDGQTFPPTSTFPTVGNGSAFDIPANATTESATSLSANATTAHSTAWNGLDTPSPVPFWVHFGGLNVAVMLVGRLAMSTKLEFVMLFLALSVGRIGGGIALDAVGFAGLPVRACTVLRVLGVCIALLGVGLASVKREAWPNWVGLSGYFRLADERGPREESRPPEGE